MAQLAVVGAGYVGLVTAACLAKLGHRVTCIEVNEARLSGLAAGEPPISEPGLAELVREQLRHGSLRFTGDYAGVERANSSLSPSPLHHARMVRRTLATFSMPSTHLSLMSGRRR